MPTHSEAKAVLNFAQTGVSMNSTIQGDRFWATVGGQSSVSTPPAIVQKAEKARLAFPLSGWDLEIPQTGWRFSPWLGNYEINNAPWIYHQSMGWIYLVQSAMDSLWIWQEELGWNWTSHSLFPYLHQHSPSAWLALQPGSSNPALVYDFPNTVWFEVGRRLLSVHLTIPQPDAGKVEGKLSLRQGEDLLLIAQPGEGFVFAGWKGDIQTGENPLRRSNISQDLTLSAHFSPIRQSFSALDLNFLKSEKLRGQALLELGLDGSSSLLSSGQSIDSAGSFSSTGYARDQFRAAMGEVSPEEISGVFNATSAVLTHPYAPWKVGHQNNVYYEGKIRQQVELEVLAMEDMLGVNCLTLLLTDPVGKRETRWIAEDSNQNVWLVHSSGDGISQSEPFILIPANPENGWKSWENASAIPLNYSVIMEFPAITRVPKLSSLSDCIHVLIKHHDSGHMESYANGLGLVKFFNL